MHAYWKARSPAAAAESVHSVVYRTSEAIWVCWCIGAYLFNVFYHDVLDLSNPTPYPVDRISVWVICKITHALLQHPAEFCVVLICHCILCCFWAISTQELIPDVIQKSKRDSATQSLQKRHFNSKRKRKRESQSQAQQYHLRTGLLVEAAEHIAHGF